MRSKLSATSPLVIFRFPRVAPAPGTVAIWPGRRVAPVIASDGDRVTVRDSWGTHSVSTKGLVFVDPRGATTNRPQNITENITHRPRVRYARADWRERW
jgi:hypothetical protein